MQLSKRSILLAFLFVSPALWAASDPLMGTWKLNVAKSRFVPGPPPQSSIVAYEPYGKDGFKVTSDTVNAEGKSLHVVYAAEYDAKGYPITGDPTHDMNYVKRINLYTHQIVNKKNGKITATSLRVISKDGKTMSITTKGTNPGGQKVYRVQVYDKQ